MAAMGMGMAVGMAMVATGSTACSTATAAAGNVLDFNNFDNCSCIIVIWHFNGIIRSFISCMSRVGGVVMFIFMFIGAALVVEPSLSLSVHSTVAGTGVALVTHGTVTVVFIVVVIVIGIAHSITSIVVIDVVGVAHCRR